MGQPPPGHWLSQARCEVYREACNVVLIGGIYAPDPVCQAARDTCSTLLPAEADGREECTVTTLVQPCNWGVPGQLGKALFQLPVCASARTHPCARTADRGEHLGALAPSNRRCSTLKMICRLHAQPACSVRQTWLFRGHQLVRGLALRGSCAHAKRPRCLSRATLATIVQPAGTKNTKAIDDR